MNNQEKTVKKVIKTGDKANSDLNHATQITQGALDEVQSINEGAQEGDVSDIALEGLEEI